MTGSDSSPRLVGVGMPSAAPRHNAPPPPRRGVVIDPPRRLFDSLLDVVVVPQFACSTNQPELFTLPLPSSLLPSSLLALSTLFFPERSRSFVRHSSLPLDHHRFASSFFTYSPARCRGSSRPIVA